ncbi:hypothetical protein Pam4_04 [Pseudanabaena phage Pam4]|nr:hypothetical protein Pam4_04 [Pseudanabaena phage Pam4]
MTSNTTPALPSLVAAFHRNYLQGHGTITAVNPGAWDEFYRLDLGGETFDLDNLGRLWDSLEGSAPYTEEASRLDAALDAARREGGPCCIGAAHGSDHTPGCYGI